MPFKIIRKDITKINTDAIVNAADTALALGGGVCRVIFTAVAFALALELDLYQTRNFLEKGRLFYDA